MEDEEGYTALNLQSRKDTSGTASPSGKQGAAVEEEDGYTALNRRPKRDSASPTGRQDGPPCPRRHLIALWIGYIGNVILAAAVIALALQLKGKPGTEAGRSIGPCSENCSAALENFRSRLRSGLCNQNPSSSSVNSTCKFCPEHWRLHRDKCYWPSADIKSWHESQDYCSARRSHLVVIQDKEEKEFIQNITVPGPRYWIGLSLSSSPENKWVWITGLQIDPNLFQEPKGATRNSCAAIKDPMNTITVDKCNTERRWVCQKDTTFL
ncbi:killer cell lectin-like receptor subfamily B member 1B allele C [Elgaria multicarinata webbii]|uniref:killer cell lectin-like receptor subfamily B member 1B allele C n=1 Tax=Elgaria multicarinata webbii TaxID=159646 RepID=UPI002FCD63E1